MDELLYQVRGGGGGGGGGHPRSSSNTSTPSSSLVVVAPPPPSSLTTTTTTTTTTTHSSLYAHYCPFLNHQSTKFLSQYSSINGDSLKRRIISHPQYANLVAAYLDCQKEAYYQLLANYKEELTRPLNEATEFLRRAESQLNSLTNEAVRAFSAGHDDEKRSSSSVDTGAPEIDSRAEDRELRSHLLKKYGGCLSGLRQELSKKKKKGKLPKEARQKLLTWWEIHSRWPYPSEMEKSALAQSTGLDQKQINNWFINQRKRHWKPSDEMQFIVWDGNSYHLQAEFYMHGHVTSNG